MNDKKEKILEAAQQLFNRFGLRKTTIDDIAKEADIGKGTIYLYFSNKEEIFLTVARNFQQNNLQKIRSAVRSETKAEKQLLKLCTSHFAQLEETLKTRPLTADIMAEAQTQPEYKTLREEFSHDFSMIVRGILETGVEAKDLKITDLDEATWHITMFIKGIAISRIAMGDPPIKPAKIDHQVGILLNGLRNSK